MMHMPLLVPMPTREATLIIAAIAAHPYVVMAIEAGYKVVCIDAFGDADTQALAYAWHQIPIKNDQFDADALIALLDKNVYSNVVGFCYGAGFEQQPALLMEVATRYQLLGNGAEVVTRCKQPKIFFEACQALSIPTPPVQLTPPTFKDGWLVKLVGGSGGSHVQHASDWRFEVSSNRYYQQALVGELCSCVFLAHGAYTHVLGFNRQWISPGADSPFRWGGVVSQVVLDERVRKIVIDYINKLSKYIDLKGINSIDFIVDGIDCWVLELNPRLSASASLYTLLRGNLMDWHVTTGRGQVPNETSNLQQIEVKTVSCAMQVIYADNPLKIAADMQWPGWVQHIPHAGQCFSNGQPLVVIRASAATATAAKQLLEQRTAVINNQLKAMVNL